MLNRLAPIIVLLGTLLLAGCAAKGEHHPDDPYESFNRKMYSLNKWIDVHMFRPVAATYSLILPGPVRSSVTNFFNNVDEIPTILNSMLQLEGAQAWNASKRLGINTTLGVAGFFDPATGMGIERDPNGLGKTFYVYGWKNSHYLFVPLLGPSTPRDFVGVIGNLYMTPWPYFDEYVEWSAVVLMGINMRAQMLDVEAVMGIAALDEYVFVRDAYLQNRRAYLEDEALLDKWTEDNAEWMFDNDAEVPGTEQ